MADNQTAKPDWTNEIFSSIKIVGLLILVVSLHIMSDRWLGFILGHYIWIIFGFTYYDSVKLFQILEKKYPQSRLKKLISFWITPLQIATFLLKLVNPMLLLSVSGLLFFATILIIPDVPILLFDHFTTFTVSDMLYSYLVTTSAFIIAVSLHRPILKHVVYRIMNNCCPDEMRKYRINELLNYILNRKNLKFSIYSLYFLFMIYYTVTAVQDETLLRTEVVHQAIMQSFLTFIAFDSLTQNTK